MRKIFITLRILKDLTKLFVIWLVIGIGLFLFYNYASASVVLYPESEKDENLRLKFDDFSLYIDSVTIGEVVEYSYMGDVYLLEDYEYFRQPNSIFDTNAQRERFFGFQFAEDTSGQKRIPEYATTSRDSWFSQVVINDWFSPLQLGKRAYASLLSTTTVPSGDGEVTSDAWANWEIAHNDTDGTANPSNTTASCRIWGYTPSPNGYFHYRMFLPFYTEIPVGYEVATSSLFLYVDTTADEVNDANSFVQIVGTTSQASVTTLANADFDTCSSVDNPSTVSAEYDLTAFGTGWKEFVITNLDAINTSGYTKLGCREGHDINDQSWVLGGDEDTGITARMLEYAGSDYDPYLEVWYIQSGGGTSTSVQATSTVGCNPFIGFSLQTYYTCTEVYNASGTLTQTQKSYSNLNLLGGYIVFLVICFVQIIIYTAKKGNTYE